MIIAAGFTVGTVWSRRELIDPTALTRQACARMTRPLTRVEWDHYLPGQNYRNTCTSPQ